MKRFKRGAVIEDFSREMVDPALDLGNGFIGDIVKASTLWNESADERVLLFIGSPLIGGIRIRIIHSNAGDGFGQLRKLGAVVTGNGLEYG